MSKKIRLRGGCSSMLSKELSEDYKTRSMGIRKGDTVFIMRGDFRGAEGKVTKVDHKKSYLYIEGIIREKADGDKVLAPIHPSNVEIKKLSLEDKRRKEILERRSFSIPEVKIIEGLEQEPKAEEELSAKKSKESAKRK